MYSFKGLGFPEPIQYSLFLLPFSPMILNALTQSVTKIASNLCSPLVISIFSPFIIFCKTTSKKESLESLGPMTWDFVAMINSVSKVFDIAFKKSLVAFLACAYITCLL